MWERLRSLSKKDLARSGAAFLSVLTLTAPGCSVLQNLGSELVYENLQGISRIPSNQKEGNPEGIYSSRADFLKNSSSTLPLSISFGRGEVRVMQIAYGSGWIPGAFAINFPGGRDECVAESEFKKKAYKELFGKFAKGERANVHLIGVIRQGATTDCDRFIHPG